MRITTVFLFIQYLAFLPCSKADAQSTFHKVFSNGKASDEDYGYGVLQTSDNGFIITGSTKDPLAGDRDVCLIKTDANGDTLWTKRYGGPDDDQGFAIQSTSDNGFIITGSSANWGGVYLIKTDSVGDTLWTKVYSGAAGFSVEQTTDKGFIIGGNSSSFGAGGSDLFLLKTDSTGNLEWTKTFGDTLSDYVGNALQTFEGGYVISGYVRKWISGVGVAYDICLVKTDSVGDTLWTKLYGGLKHDFASAVRQMPDSGFIICGHKEDIGDSSYELYLIRTNSSGDTLWTKSYRENNIDIMSRDIQLTSDSGFIVSGYRMIGPGTSIFVYVLKTNLTGDTLWTRLYGAFPSGVYDIRSIRETTDKGFILAGNIDNYVTGTNEDILLIKIDSNGNSNCHFYPTFLQTENTNTLIGTGIITGSGGVANNTATDVSNAFLIDADACDLFNTVDDVHKTDFELQIYPNPSTGTFTVTLPPSMAGCDLLVYDVLGNLIHHSPLTTHQFDLSYLPSGIYFIQAKTKEATFSRKIIIQR